MYVCLFVVVLLDVLTLMIFMPLSCVVFQFSTIANCCLDFNLCGL